MYCTPRKSNEETLPSIGNWVNELLGNAWGHRERGGADVSCCNPSIDIAESDKDITIHVELPGVDPKDVNISLEKGVLTIAGEKKSSSEEEGEDYRWAERSFGSFKRLVHLPDSIDPEQVTAEYDKGVLEVRVAKAPAAQPRRIDVKQK